MEKAYLIAVLTGSEREGDDHLAELKELLRTAGAGFCGQMVQRREAPEPATYFGKGKLAELKEELSRIKPDLIVVEDELSPTQQRNLENSLDGVRIIDRTALILDIFAQHAHSAEGKFQVELAQLEFNFTRMRGKGTILSRLGGGIGTRGPGETRLEVDQRVARKRISTLKKRLKNVSGSRDVMRRSRLASRLPLIALAGYTNAGKSTLLNSLTNSELSVDNRLFETLDPVTRAFEFDDQTYLVTDTVGFIQKLPHQLVEAFHSTLEETLVANLILHVADAGQPENELKMTIDAVEKVLEEIAADKIPKLLVMNKKDLIEKEQLAFLRRLYPDAVFISAQQGDGLGTLKNHIRDFFNSRLAEVELFFPYGDGRLIGEIYRAGTNVELENAESGTIVRARIPMDEAGKWSRFTRK